MENAGGIDLGEILILMKVLGKGKPLGQTHYTNINSNLVKMISVLESQPPCTFKVASPLKVESVGILLTFSGIWFEP